ncbi:MAG: hypothetical protein P8Z36_17255 [Gemmatimonadota bacterium]
MILLLGACSDSTAPANTCADFQGTWKTQSFLYTASADPTTTADLSSVASIDMTVDDNCNFTGTAVLPDIAQDTADINGSFTLDPTLSTLTMMDATPVGPAINYTYQYTFSGNTLTWVNPSLQYDFDGPGPNPYLPATLTITFLKQ